MPTSIWFWIAFHLGVFIAIAVDLASFKRRHRALSMRAAALRSLLWVLLSLGFSLIVSQMLGPDRALDRPRGCVAKRAKTLAFDVVADIEH